MNGQGQKMEDIGKKNEVSRMDNVKKINDDDGECKLKIKDENRG